VLDGGFKATACRTVREIVGAFRKQPARIQITYAKMLELISYFLDGKFIRSRKAKYQINMNIYIITEEIHTKFYALIAIMTL